MKIEAGLSAYVSGAGSGIGRGIATALAARGIRVGVCDIRLDDARETAAMIAEAGGDAIAIATDVSDPNSVEAAADRIEAEYGTVSVVCNNAGIAMHGVPVHEVSLDDWEWVIGVNIKGVIHGIRTFLPRLLAAGRPAHIVNTASIGGFQVNPTFLTGPYSMTKFAVVALSEALEQEQAETPIGVSVLAPAAVRTGIHLSERSRPERFGGAYVREQNHFMGDLIQDGTEPRMIGERVVEAIEQDEFYIFTHAETREWLERRHRRISGAFAVTGSETSDLAAE